MLRLLELTYDNLVGVFADRYEKGPSLAKALYRAFYKNLDLDAWRAEAIRVSPGLSDRLRQDWLFSPGQVIDEIHQDGLVETITVSWGLRSCMNEKSKKAVIKQAFNWDLRALRLPKLVEAAPQGRELVHVLTDHARPLRPGGKILVPTVAFNLALAEALGSAHRAGQMVRSLEGAERKLAAEDRGLGLVDKKSGVLRGERVSRLLVLADDGAERFYRLVEKLLRQHGPRVLALRLEVKAEILGEMLFGPGRRVLLLLLDHKEAVSAVLQALSESPDRSAPQPVVDEGH